MPASMNNSVNVAKRGSPIWQLAFCTSTGLITGTSFQGPLLSKSDIDDMTAWSSVTDEGDNLYWVAGQINRTVDLTGIQQDIAALQLMTSSSYLNNGNQLCTFVKEISTVPYSDNSIGYFVGAIMKGIGGMKITKQGNETPYKFAMINNQTAVAVNLACFANSAFKATLTGTVTIPINAGYALVTFAAN